MDRERLLDKIKKLLELGKRTPYREEAETAMGLVQQLLLKHNLSLGEVESFQPAEEFGEEPVWEGKQRPWEQATVEQLVQEFFFVRISYLIDRKARSRTTYFFGEPHNIAAARYVFVYLCRVFRELWADYRKQRKLTKRYAREFYQGLGMGLYSKLSAERREVAGASDAAKNALILVGRQLSRRFNEYYGGMKTEKLLPVKTKDARVSCDAIAMGRKIEIRKGVAAGPQTAAIEGPMNRQAAKDAKA